MIFGRALLCPWEPRKEEEDLIVPFSAVTLAAFD
jgi:hypothetical protein